MPLKLVLFDMVLKVPFTFVGTLAPLLRNGERQRQSRTKS